MQIGNYVVIGLVGNKTDLIDTVSENESQITTQEQSEQMAKNINASVNQQLSAKNQNQVQELFNQVAKSILEQIQNKTAVKVNNQKSSKLTKSSFIDEGEVSGRRKCCET